jgi:hypothetical protein
LRISSLNLRISVPIVLVSALAIGLTVFLNVGKLERTLDEVEQSKLHFTLADLKDNLETGLDLGLLLRGLENAQAAIDFETRADPDILSISVVDTEGLVVFHSGSAAATPMAPLGSFKGAGWNRREPDALVAGLKLSNNFGVTAGAVVLRYSPRSHDRFVQAISSQLGAAALAAMLLSSACFVVGIQMLGRRMTGTLRTMEDALEGKPLDPRSDAAAQALGAQCGQTTAAARAELQAAHQALAPAAGTP